MTVEPSRRRAYDVEPAVEVYVQDALRETRHELRNEIAAVGAQVAAAAILSTREHADVRSALDRLLAAHATLAKHEERITALEQTDAVDQASALATDKLLTRQRTQFYALAGLIVTAAGVISAFGH